MKLLLRDQGSVRFFPASLQENPFGNVKLINGYCHIYGSRSAVQVGGMEFQQAITLQVKFIRNIDR